MMVPVHGTNKLKACATRIRSMIKGATDGKIKNQMVLIRPAITETRNDYSTE